MQARTLTASDREAIERLCSPQPEYNLFFLANLDQLSRQQELVEYWGVFDGAGRLAGALLRYHVLWYACALPGADLHALAQVIERKAQPAIILNDNVGEGAGLAPLLANYRVELDLSGSLRRLTPADFRPAQAPCPARRASPEDVEPLARFYEQAPEDVRRGPDSLRRSMAGGRRTFLVERDGQILACALTTAEIPGLGMAGGLYAPDPLEGPACLAAALSALARSLFEEQKRVCAVTRHPAIEAVCERLGFERIGPWRILHMARK